MYDEVETICAGKHICTYLKCDTGLEKYAHFQV